MELFIGEESEESRNPGNPRNKSGGRALLPGEERRRIRTNMAARRGDANRPSAELAQPPDSQETKIPAGEKSSASPPSSMPSFRRPRCKRTWRTLKT